MRCSDLSGLLDGASEKLPESVSEGGREAGSLNQLATQIYSNPMHQQKRANKSRLNKSQREQTGCGKILQVRPIIRPVKSQQGANFYASP